MCSHGEMEVVPFLARILQKSRVLLMQDITSGSSFMGLMCLIAGHVNLGYVVMLLSCCLPVVSMVKLLFSPW